MVCFTRPRFYASVLSSNDSTNCYEIHCLHEWAQKRDTNLDMQAHYLQACPFSHIHVWELLCLSKSWLMCTSSWINYSKLYILNLSVYRVVQGISSILIYKWSNTNFKSPCTLIQVCLIHYLLFAKFRFFVFYFICCLSVYFLLNFSGWWRLQRVG